MIPDDMLPPSDDGDSDTEDLADLVVNMNRVCVGQLESESEDSCSEDEEEEEDVNERNIDFLKDSKDSAKQPHNNSDNVDKCCSIGASANSSVK